jgi:hypothetical protein
VWLADHAINLLRCVEIATRLRSGDFADRSFGDAGYASLTDFGDELRLSSYAFALRLR